jgi:hypothetical protein
MAAFSSDPISVSFFGSSQDTNYNPLSTQLEVGLSNQEKHATILQGQALIVQQPTNVVEQGKVAFESEISGNPAESLTSLETPTSNSEAVNLTSSTQRLVP